MEVKQIQLIKPGKTLPFGMTVRGHGMNFSIAMPTVKRLELHLYTPDCMEEPIICDLTEVQVQPGIYAAYLPGLSPKGLAYEIWADQVPVQDPYAKALPLRQKWGDSLCLETSLRYGCDGEDFPWEGDKPLTLPIHELRMYKLHVRGYTIHKSSGVKSKGTFLGLMQKIPYIQSLGINCVELMPVVEFTEQWIQPTETKGQEMNFKQVLEPSTRIPKEYLESEAYKSSARGRLVAEPVKTNYWGYGESFFFAPKAAYGCGQVITEFKQMVKGFHKAGIEVVLELMFPENMSPIQIVDCLRYWAANYHVDGFHINEGAAPLEILARDPFLAQTKLFCGGYPLERIYAQGMTGEKHLGVYDTGFMYDMRRVLKGDNDIVRGFVNQMMRHSNQEAYVHYLTNNNGFTLMDLVSYNEKHNEENGEGNTDGESTNLSWNCGVEGPSRKRVLQMLRQKQVRNGFVLNLLSPGIPLIYAGDEFLNSQRGNNNAYCQDNEVSWLNWRQAKANVSMIDFVKKLMDFRQNHGLMATKKGLSGLDTLACGYPDISFHSAKAWYLDYSSSNHMVGVMYWGAYEKHQNPLFMAYNMHWEDAAFALPALKGCQWQMLIDTANPSLEEGRLCERSCIIESRSIVVFEGVPKDCNE